MEIVVEMDSKGRLLVPAEVRREIKSRRFTLRVHGDKLELEPIANPDKVKGKYRGLLRVSLEELEEEQEKFVLEGKR